MRFGTSLWLLLAASAVYPLRAADATFCIAGTVVNAATGEPLRHAAVSTPDSAALTDPAGAFRFCGLAPGAYSAQAEKPGFIVAGTRVTVGPSREDLVLRLPPLAVIAGKVLDGDGEPVEGAVIQLLSFAIGNGRRKVHLEATQVTDDRGEYRIPQLKPGRYVLRAAGWRGPEHPSPDAEISAAFPPVYYGGAPDLAAAASITLDAGREFNADLTVALSGYFKISGTLAGFSPREPATIELLSPDGEPAAAPASFQPSSGTFRVNYVPSGSYTLRATQGEGEQRLRGEQPVQVGAADLYDVSVSLAGPVELRGIVRVAANSEQSPISPNCGVGLSPAATSVYEEPLESSTAENGAFEIAGVLPGRYRLRLDCAAGYLSSLRAGGADLMARNEIVITGGAPPLIEATLNTDGATLDLVPTFETDSAPSWLVLMPESGNDLLARFSLLQGKVSLSGIAPGQYQVFTWSGSPYAFEYASAGARQAWTAHASSVQLAARDHQTVAVKVSPGEDQ